MGRSAVTGLMRAAKMHGAVLRHDTVIDLVRGPSAAMRSARARERRDRRRRRRRYRDGTMVDPCCALAAAAGGVGLQGPAWCLKPARPFPPRHCSSSIAYVAARLPTRISQPDRVGKTCPRPRPGIARHCRALDHGASDSRSQPGLSHMTSAVQHLGHTSP
jgi:hypothetical protein